MKLSGKKSRTRYLVTIDKKVLRLLFLLATSAILFTATPGAADSHSERGPRGGSCSESCDRKASECIDSCGEKFKDDKQRVECKLQCVSDRQKCESSCAPPPPTP